MLELLLWPLVAGLVLTGIHAYFGLHVLARGVIFVDLSLAQVAALGLAVAILAGHSVHSEAGYWYALAFAIAGAVLFAAARPYETSLPQEAIIGIVYAVSAALGVIVLDRAPLGAEHIKQLIIGSILTVTPQDVGQLIVLYGAIGVLHFICRRPLVEVSFQPHLAATAQRRFLWDIVFYSSFALVVTSSVRIAGVLLVFSYLIVPAALAGLLTADLHRRLIVAWGLGALLTAVGLYASWTLDLPTGPAIVTAFGGAVALVALAATARRLTRRRAGTLACALAVLAGLPLLTAPQMDQPWLDAVEGIAPILQTAFLDSGERLTRTEALVAIGNARAELARLRAVDQDVRWGKVEMAPEQAERLRQYLMGKSEISAGDQLVLRHLRSKARERQRFALGLPILIAGVCGLYALMRRGPH
ncbi:MAG: metal ABC transporter permease [Hyphomicrobiaceae bacterium]|nr:metal ABC transporter permease [Hyphomicrobiaceae bacterium]